jgi:hypothetical protein
MSDTPLRPPISPAAHAPAPQHAPPPPHLALAPPAAARPARRPAPSPPRGAGAGACYTDGPPLRPAGAHGGPPAGGMAAALEGRALLGMARDNKPDDIRSAVRLGVPVDFTNPIGQTALMVAALWGNLEAMKVGRGARGCWGRCQTDGCIADARRGGAGQGGAGGEGWGTPAELIGCGRRPGGRRTLNDGGQRRLLPFHAAAHPTVHPPPAHSQPLGTAGAWSRPQQAE